MPDTTVETTTETRIVLKSVVTALHVPVALYSMGREFFVCLD